jgi:NADPH:quinone reductase-like Zn-dependent oxidoreductase
MSTLATDREITMKAIVQDKYGSADVLELTDIDKPTPKDDEILLRVHAASAHIGDWHVMTGLPYVGRMAFGPVSYTL